ncbi:MAG: hypothetical protein K1X79_01500 [Oligoflexia bacterium]|nr:hypothetical protein [Oligoflexia bacterium]
MQYRISYMAWLAATASFLLGVYVSKAAADSPIPGLEMNISEAFSNTCTVATFNGLLKEPAILGGQTVTFLNQKLLICINLAILNSSRSLDQMAGLVFGGGYGWSISPPDQGSMPGFRAFIRDRLFAAFGDRLAIIIMPILSHMQGGTGQSTGASVENSRILALAGVLEAQMGIHKLAYGGFSRGGEAIVGLLARFNGLACTGFDLAGSYNNGQSTPTPALIDSLGIGTRLNLGVCPSGDTWANPFISYLDQYRKRSGRPGGAVPGTYVAGTCTGHDAVLMDPAVQALIDSSIAGDCLASAFTRRDDLRASLPQVLRLSDRELRKLKRKARLAKRRVVISTQGQAARLR